ncbi:MAG: hypothetical protein IK147_00995 [Clostridia bacterium]|nr:hypothetical protein [Clostridia bacterium]
MENNRWVIIFGKYDGLEKKAVNLINSAVFDHYRFPVSCFNADEVDKEIVNTCNLILVGTAKDNKYLGELVKKGVLKKPEKPQGYSASVKESLWNGEKDVMAVCGFDDAGVLYGSVDFVNKYLGYLIYRTGVKDMTTCWHMYFDSPFTVRPPHWEEVSAPSVETRGAWTWGHVIYDYKSYFDNMALLKLNEIVIWNNFIPINSSDVVDYAHSLGIKVIWGYAWGWNTDCNVSMKMDDEGIKHLSEDIFAKFEKEYANAKGDGIYFQSATEVNTEYIDGKLIAERVVSLVNLAAGKILDKYPDLEIQFGLHTGSVKHRLEYIAKVDPRVKIVWENCGSFPFYDHSGIDIVNVGDLKETMDFTAKIAQLRSEEDNFGLVMKEMTFLDWTLFTHPDKNLILGENSKNFIEERLIQKRKLWKFSQTNWIANLDYMQKIVKNIVDTRKNNNIEAVIEDGIFEKEIPLSAALYAETLWNCEKDSKETFMQVSQYPCVKFANLL